MGGARRNSDSKVWSHWSLEVTILRDITKTALLFQPKQLAPRFDVNAPDALVIDHPQASVLPICWPVLACPCQTRLFLSRLICFVFLLYVIGQGIAAYPDCHRPALVAPLAAAPGAMAWLCRHSASPFPPRFHTAELTP